MDAMTVSLFILLVLGGAGLLALIALIPDAEKGVRISLTAFFGLVLLLVMSATLNTEIEGTPAKFVWGQKYVYIRLPNDDNLMHLLDQDEELAYYSMPCSKIQGGCEAIPERKSFKLIEGNGPDDLRVVIVDLPKGK